MKKEERRWKMEGVPKHAIPAKPVPAKAGSRNPREGAQDWRGELWAIVGQLKMCKRLNVRPDGAMISPS